MKLKYTGHPLVDIGFATIAVISKRDTLEEVTEDDLEKVAQFIESEYVINPLKAFLTVVFTSNAWFAQHAYNPDRSDLTPEKRQEIRAKRQQLADAHLRQWKIAGDPNQHCVFTGEPAITEVLSNKLSSGRLARAQLPLVQGDEAINFFAEGSPGLPVSGLALLALQVFPLGCAKAGNGILAVHSSEMELVMQFARTFYQQNIQAITQAKLAEDSKIPGSSRSPRTLLIETLLTIEQEYDPSEADERSAISGITAYNINNGKTPQLDMHILPYEITTFMLEAKSRYSEAWQTLIRKGWEQAPKKYNDTWEPRRNYVYEDLFKLPDQAARFIRTYFLHMPEAGYKHEQDPRTSYTLKDTYTLIEFDLVELFLRRILLMQDAQIDSIKAFGIKLANYVRAENGKKFFRLFAGETKYYSFRERLIKASEDYVRTGAEPLFTVDEYINLFEREYDGKSANWRLGRDLILIHMIDQLKDWLSRNPDALPDRSEESTSSEEE